ncbi:MAG: class I SAM-dependent methyltransferase [Desulfitobacteriaceae bacterium]
MEDHVQVYKTKAEQYERLISREDYQNIIPITLKDICSFENADIIDLGAGTGRLTCLFATEAKSMTAFDLSQHMLNVTAEKLTRMGLSNWKTTVADHRTLPVKDGSADIVMAGWSISYVAIPNDTNWHDNIYKVISEMKRVVRPGGTLIIIETLGTGNETPQTHDFLKGYFDLLEIKYGFSHRWIRTDYRFESVEVAEELTRFFFNDELADRIVRQELTIVPECTGVWWLRL